MRRSGIWDGLGAEDSGLSVCSFGFRLGSEDDLCGFRHPLFYGIFSVEDGVMTRFSQEEMHEADWCLTGPVASWKHVAMMTTLGVAMSLPKRERDPS